jgi:hypothetical protein
MSEGRSSRGGGVALTGAGIVMILCCAVGPAVLGAAAGSVVGGWIGVTIACVLAGVAGLGLYLRRGRSGC